MAAALGLPQLLDDLIPRVLHCCWEDTWGSRLGGVAAVRLLWRKLPAEYLTAWLPQLLRALMVVTRHLPEHSVPELTQINETLTGLIDKCYGPGSPGAAAVARYNELHPAPPAPVEEEAAEKPAADDKAAGKDEKDSAGKKEGKESKDEKDKSSSDKEGKEGKEKEKDKAEGEKSGDGDGMEVDVDKKREGSASAEKGALDGEASAGGAAGKSDGGGGASEGRAGSEGGDAAKRGAAAAQKPGEFAVAVLVILHLDHWAGGTMARPHTPTTNF